MKSRSSFMAFGGVIVLGASLLATTNAQAYGGMQSQWRPAQAYAPAPVAYSYPKQAHHAPHFRPWNAPIQRPASVNRYPYSVGVQSNTRYSARPVQFATRYPTQAMPQTYPGRTAAAPHHYPRHAGAGLPWGQGYAPTMQPWGYQAWPQPPVFTRQFAWQPAGQPWIAPRSAAQQAPQFGYQTGYRMPSRPVERQFRPRHHASQQMSNAPTYRGWRPAAHPVASVASGRELYMRQAAPQQHQALYRPHRAVASTTTWAPPRHTMPPAGFGNHTYWRPVAAPVAQHWPVAAVGSPDFRPPAYGRSQMPEQRIAQRDSGGFKARSDLPGWVTTYPDRTSVDCTWCSGS